MADGDFVVAIDSGTTGTTALVIDKDLEVKAKKTVELPQIFPRPGWVEHDPEAIFALAEDAIAGALEEAGVRPTQVVALGVTNQRETTIVFNRETLKPYFNAIVWQCRRTAPICEELKKAKLTSQVRKRTGLVIDPYFSATKIVWLLRHVKGLRKEAEKGHAVFGTVDSYLIARFTGGEVHATEPSNASRTMLYNIVEKRWDGYLCDKMGIPASMLPDVKDSSGVFGYTKGMRSLPDGVPIAGVAGDQQAATFGQACFTPGEAKCTYGTGSFTLLNTGKKPVPSRYGLVTTVLWSIDGKTEYALEGSVFIAGAAVQWLRDGLKLIERSEEIEELAAQVSSSEGVYLVPAFQGLGAPYWRPEAKGIIYGITRSTTAAHIARATLEGIAYMNAEVMLAMKADYGRRIKCLKVDGGAARNDLLMQFQSDILGVEIVRPRIIETTALGAGMLAGLGVKLWKSRDELAARYREERHFSPALTRKKREVLLQQWRRVVEKA